MHEISRDGVFFWSSNVYSSASLCCAVSVVIMGFYLFPWHMDEGFHRAFVASHTISSRLRVAQRHEFDAEGRISPWPESAPHHPTVPLHFSFVSLSIFSFSFFFPSFCIFRSTAPSCLHIAWSKTTNQSFTACSPCAFSLSPLVLFLLSFVAPVTSQENAGCRGNEMTHWKWYCWQVMTWLLLPSATAVSWFGMVAGLFLKVAISERCCLEHRVPGGGIFLPCSQFCYTQLNTLCK